MRRRLHAFISHFIASEVSSGFLLIFCAFLALMVANISGIKESYHAFFKMPLGFIVSSASFSKSLGHWINDGLMAFFFLLIGLEIKREIIEGELKDPRKAALPLFAAFGGMLFPALVYVALTFQHPDLLRGWAIPCATDIAFALAVIHLLGPRAPKSLKVLLLSIAIIDDIGAILIIALFYTQNIDLFSLAMGGVCCLGLFACLKRGLQNLLPYGLLGILLWVFLFKSGIHATLAGVITAFFIPLKGPQSPLKHLEKKLHPYVAFFIMPVFAFSNAGVTMSDMSLNDLLSPLVMGIVLGLCVGKPLGVGLMSWVCLRLNLGEKPQGVGWKSLWGIGFLTGIGFTMSLFIALLAFQDDKILSQVRLGVILASLLSALLGYAFLKACLHQKASLRKESCPE